MTRRSEPHARRAGHPRVSPLAPCRTAEARGADRGGRNHCVSGPGPHLYRSGAERHRGEPGPTSVPIVHNGLHFLDADRFGQRILPLRSICDGRTLGYSASPAVRGQCPHHVPGQRALLHSFGCQHVHGREVDLLVGSAGNEGRGAHQAAAEKKGEPKFNNVKPYLQVDEDEKKKEWLGPLVSSGLFPLGAVPRGIVYFIAFGLLSMWMLQ